jgi:hypothetical protein
MNIASVRLARAQYALGLVIGVVRLCDSPGSMLAEDPIPI